ncbi:S1/P1 nuclease [Aurantibacillus circumpalustris]|uniref:S1/P1 nuclease n=1 Tax=Aurantibacillus circumpalustris TaxID=3036359 RepID=UPI00295A9819|nr:S1/P1 nuclease [Aurantibacillus circumpalustris]
MNRRFLLIFLLFGIIGSASAWGPRGHKIVTQIALKYLDKSVIDSVNKYLDDISLEKAGYWMDEVVMNSSYDFMEPWHFIAIESDKTYVKTKDPNVVNVLENLISTLKKKKSSRKEMFLSLKLLTHLVADIHQPLHCGFGKDKGGSLVKLRFFFKSTNLHEVWDSEILEYQSITAEDCLRLSSQLTKRDITTYQKVDVEAWMQESRVLLSYVYDYKGNKLDDEYLDKTTPIIKMQLVKAGLRLASVLNQTFIN